MGSSSFLEFQFLCQVQQSTKRCSTSTSNVQPTSGIISLPPTSASAGSFSRQGPALSASWPFAASVANAPVALLLSGLSLLLRGQLQQRRPRSYEKEELLCCLSQDNSFIGNINDQFSPQLPNLLPLCNRGAARLHHQRRAP